MDVIGCEAEAITWDGKMRHGYKVGLLLWDGRICVETCSI